MTNKEPQKYNAGTEDKATQQEMILQLENLKHQEGWKILQRVFQNNIKFLENLIIKKIDDQGNAIEKEVMVDRLRDKRGYMVDLMDSPDNLIEQLRTNDEAVVEELDPYYKDVKDIENSEEDEANK